MDELQLSLIKKIDELESILHKANKDINTAPEGSLRIANTKPKVQYYRRMEPKDTHGKYIKYSETDLIKGLAQKEYARKICSEIDSELDMLKKIYIEYNPEELKDVYNNMLFHKKEYIKPYILSEQEYANIWLEEKIKIKKERGFDDLKNLSEDEVIVTENGERVRSKSEKILADKLYMMQIPYVYECPLRLEGYGVVKPDFTVFNIRTGNEYIWEHLGLMDNKEYCEKAIKKIETYEKNKIYPGKNLILSFETEKHTINTKIVENLIKEYLI